MSRRFLKGGRGGSRKKKTDEEGKDEIYLLCLRGWDIVNIITLNTCTKKRGYTHHILGGLIYIGEYTQTKETGDQNVLTGRIAKADVARSRGLRGM